MSKNFLIDLQKDLGTTGVRQHGIAYKVAKTALGREPRMTPPALVHPARTYPVGLAETAMGASAGVAFALIEKLEDQFPDLRVRGAHLEEKYRRDRDNKF